MFFSGLDIIFLCLPLCIGMICAYRSVKQDVVIAPVSDSDSSAIILQLYDESQNRRSTLSSDLWNGYLIGNAGFVISSLILIFTALLMLNETIWESFIMTIGFTFLMSLVSLVIGFILYMPCAYIAYNFKAQKRAEAEIARTQQQIIKDIQKEPRNL
ncbi:MAG: ABC-type spermidine/putrescine transport system permease subunit II [Cryomorphaceae bacterium]|jgi:ABC-type spermidine/putrescine transport system permease subunit II